MNRLVRISFEIGSAVACLLLALVASGQWLMGTEGAELGTPVALAFVAMACGLVAVIDGTDALLDTVTEGAVKPPKH